MELYCSLQLVLYYFTLFFVITTSRLRFEGNGWFPFFQRNFETISPLQDDISLELVVALF